MNDLTPDEKRKDLQSQLNKLFEGMNKSVQIPTDKSVSPIEEKLRNIQKAIPNPLQPGTTSMIPDAPKPELIVVDDHIVVKDLNMLISLVLAKLAETNPDVKGLLDKFGFEFTDENGKTVYPKKTKKK